MLLGSGSGHRAGVERIPVGEDAGGQPERKSRRGRVRRLEEVSGGESVCDREQRERKRAGIPS